jgi:hypothetical protein
MKHILAILALGAIALPALARPPATASILGEWRGTYVCGQGLTALHLKVASVNRGRVTAIFDFGPVKENPLVPHGRYEMSGDFNAKTGRVKLGAGRWIEQPSGYFTVDLDGYLTASGARITGVVPAAGCSVFDLTRGEVLVG